MKDEELKNLLTIRNQSILAHSLQTAKQETYRKLLMKAKQNAQQAITNLNQLIRDSTFIKLKP